MIKSVSGILYIFSEMWQMKHFVLYCTDVILDNKVYCLPPKYPAAITYLCYKCLITTFAVHYERFVCMGRYPNIFSF